MSFRALLLAVCLGACAPVSYGPPSGAVLVSSPRPDAHVSDPFQVVGVAPSDWYFEAVFEARLIDARGRVLAEAPAQAQSDWMTQGPVPFVVNFTYSSGVSQAATVVLTEDQSGEISGRPREIRIPVVLSPTR